MNRSTLPSEAFADPTGDNRADVEALGRQALTRVLDHIGGAAMRSPLPETMPLGNQQLIPDTPHPMPELLDELREMLAAR